VCHDKIKPLEQDKFFRILGRITFLFSKIDFIISNIAVELGIVDSYPEFYAITSAEKKIKRLREKAFELSNLKIKKPILIWLDNLDELREKRNMVIHSIIMKNVSDDNDYRLHNFKKEKNGIQRIVEIYTSKDFVQLDNELIAVHNSGFKLLEEIKKSTNTKKRM